MVFFSKKQPNWFFKNFLKSGMIDRKYLGQRSLNRIFNALSIGLQYTLSLEWPGFWSEVCSYSYTKWSVTNSQG